MPPMAGQEPHDERIEVRAKKAHKEVIRKIRDARPEYTSDSSVVIAGLYTLARKEGVKV